MSIPELLGLLAGVATVVAVVAVGYVVLRSTLARTTSELWKQEADALRHRLETVEAAAVIADEVAKEATRICEQRVGALETTNKILSEQVSGAAAVERLAATMERQHQDVMQLLGGRRQGDG